MKIKKLTIHNIASIEDASIDFTQAPLADSDLFLITGDTGSGKSTILDAICLVLYATTPRMENTEMEGAVSDDGKIDIQVEDPRRLLREGTGEGYVRMEFDGTNGIPYMAEWMVHRANKSASGRLQGKKWSLKNLVTGKTLDKDKEISSEVVLATGLATFDQFCRTTMLAQGEFTRFLNSKDEKKAEILEKITGADIYAKIGKKIYELSNEKSTKYDKAKQDAKDQAPLPEEKRNAIEAEKKSLEGQLQDAKQDKSLCERKRQFIRDERRLKDTINKADLKQKDAEEVIKQDDFKSKSLLVKQYDETSEVRNDYSTNKTKINEAERLKQKIRNLAETYSFIRAGLDYMKSEKSGLEDESEKVKRTLDEDKPNLPVIEKAQTVEAHLKTMTDGEKSISGWTSEIQDVESEIKEALNPDLDEKKQKWDEAKNAHKDAESDLNKAKQTVAAANLALVRETLRQKKELEADIRLAKVQLAALRAAKATRDKEKAAIEEDKKELSGLLEQKEGLERKLDTEKEVFTNAEETFNKVKLAEDNLVGDIRDSLSIGDICPVCRQRIVSALPNSDEVSAIVRPAREAYDNAKRKKIETEDKLRTLNSRIETVDKDLERRKNQYETHNPVPDRETETMEALERCGIGKITEETEVDLDDLLEKSRMEIKGLEQKDGEGKLLEAEVDAAWGKKEDLSKKEKKAKEDYDGVKTKIKEATEKIDKFRGLIENERNRIIDATSDIEKILIGSRWENNWKVDLQFFGTSLVETVRNHESNSKRERELDKQIGQISMEVSAIGSLLTAVEEKESSWSALLAQNPVGVPDLKTQAEELKDEVFSIENTLKHTVEDAKQAGEKVESFLREHSGYTTDLLDTLLGYSKDEIARKKEDVEKTYGDVKEAKAIKKATEESLADLLVNKPEIGEDDTEDSLDATVKKLEETIGSLTAQIALLQKDLDDDQQKRDAQGNLLKQVENLKLEADRWSRLNSIFGNADGKVFRKIAQSYVLGSLVHAANGYMEKLTDRYTLKVHPGSFIIELEDAYQGFASRVASTISGGESFLVSLSLALALSDIGTGLPVDTVFIDEGFGTLSGEPLQRAVGMLKTLNKQVGRHVGIISHIKDLREKIPVKIVVEQSGNSSASTVKAIED